jgi:hypothetical protein
VEGGSSVDREAFFVGRISQVGEGYEIGSEEFGGSVGEYCWCVMPLSAKFLHLVFSFANQISASDTRKAVNHRLRVGLLRAAQIGQGIDARWESGETIKSTFRILWLPLWSQPGTAGVMVQSPMTSFALGSI